MTCTCVNHTASGTSWVNPKCPTHGTPPVAFTFVPQAIGVAQPAANVVAEELPANTHSDLSSAASIKGLVERLEALADTLSGCEAVTLREPILANLVQWLREAAALLRPSRPSGERWEPIETAPFDVEILTTGSVFGPCVAVRRKSGDFWIIPIKEWMVIHPTHWMLLPASPVPERRGADQ